MDCFGRSSVIMDRGVGGGIKPRSNAAGLLPVELEGGCAASPSCEPRSNAVMDIFGRGSLIRDHGVGGGIEPRSNAVGLLPVELEGGCAASPGCELRSNAAVSLVES